MYSGFEVQSCLRGSIHDLKRSIEKGVALWIIIHPIFKAYHRNRISVYSSID